ncbi:hypothetical protein KM043_004753 [Ampulex compressa]|nr:hypothetical protein KM043_004753 [Ampulex compressa]
MTANEPGWYNKREATTSIGRKEREEEVAEEEQDARGWPRGWRRKSGGRETADDPVVSSTPHRIRRTSNSSADRYEFLADSRKGGPQEGSGAVEGGPGKRKDRRRKRRGEANRKVVLEGEERGEQAENGEHGVNASDGNGNPAFSAFRGEERGPCQLAIGRHVVRSSERRWCFECSANERTPTWHFSTAIYVEGQRATGSPQLNPTHSHAVSLPLCFFFSPCSLSLPLRLSVGTGEDTRFGIRSGCARFHEKSVARLS